MLPNQVQISGLDSIHKMVTVLLTTKYTSTFVANNYAPKDKTDRWWEQGWIDGRLSPMLEKLLWPPTTWKGAPGPPPGQMVNFAGLKSVLSRLKLCDRLGGNILTAL